MLTATNYTNLQSWMVQDLKLKGNKLIAYAIVFGFSQDGDSEMRGSINYFCQWLNCTRKTAITTLQQLEEDGLIVKMQREKNGVKHNFYKAVKGSVKITPVQNLHQCKNYTKGSVKITPNNNIYNNNILPTQANLDKSVNAEVVPKNKKQAKLQSVHESLKSELNKLHKEDPQKYTKEHCLDFYNYWWADVDDITKQHRRMLQRSWNTKGRFATWLKIANSKSQSKAYERKADRL